MGRIDIYRTRRGMYNLCKFWDRDELGEGNSEEYIYATKPMGIFYAKERSPEDNDVQTLFSSFMADEHSIIIETNDDIRGMRENCLVKFGSDIWRVENVQKTIRRRESEFNPNFNYIWYLQLRR